jgi:Integrase core domain
VLTDNGKVFTGRFGLHPVEVLFDRLCRENGISHRLTAVRAPTTTGKIERFHQSLRKEFLADRSFRSMAVAQDALDEWVNDYTPRTTPGARDGHSGRSFSIAACESDGTLVPTESTASLTVSRAGSANCRRFPSLRSAQSSGGGLLLHDRHGDDPASGNRSGWLSGMIRCRPPSRSSPACKKARFARITVERPGVSIKGRGGCHEESSPDTRPATRLLSPIRQCPLRLGRLSRSLCVRSNPFFERRPELPPLEPPRGFWSRWRRSRT